MTACVACRQNDPAAGAESISPAMPVPVRVATAQSVTLHPSIDLVGTLVAIPERTVSISPQIAGQVRQVMTVEGDTLRAGDELIRFDSRPAEAQLARAEASVNEKKAVLARLQHGSRPQEIEIARQNAEKAKASMDALNAKIEALASLRKNNEVSEVQYAEMESSLKSAEAEYAATSVKLKLIEAGARPEEIDEAQAQVAIAEAELTTAKLAVEFCIINTPIDGTVTQLFAQQGMYVQPSTALAVVIDLSHLFAKVRIPGAYLAKVKAGAKVDVHVSSFPKRLFSGVVARVSGQADPNTGNVSAYVLIANDNGLLRPDLACRARVWLPEVPDALVVPVAAIADRDGMPVVTTVKDHKAYETEVMLGIQTEEAAQVTQGLSLGDMIVTKGGYGLPDGCPVHILPDASTSETKNASQ